MDFLIQEFLWLKLLMKWMFRPIRLFFMAQVRDIFLFVVNVLLTIITLGIYLPWALMKCKRYLYANMS